MRHGYRVINPPPLRPISPQSALMTCSPDRSLWSNITSHHEPFIAPAPPPSPDPPTSPAPPPVPDFYTIYGIVNRYPYRLGDMKAARDGDDSGPAWSGTPRESVTVAAIGGGGAVGVGATTVFWGVGETTSMDTPEPCASGLLGSVATAAEPTGDGRTRRMQNNNNNNKKRGKGRGEEERGEMREDNMSNKP